MFINSLIRFSVQNKFVIGLFVIGLIIWGSWALTQIPIDAVPDITDNQVQVITVSPTLAPQEVEQYITVPVELQLANLPGVNQIRSVSKFGLSVITIVFDEKVPVLESRQLVNEQLPLAAEEIPNDLGTPRMMPITTGLGEIYQYVLTPEPGYEDQFDPQEIRTVQDWIVKRYLNGIEGVVEISSFGGYVKQIEVAVLPEKLRALGITLLEVEEALQRDNQNVGSAYLEQAGRAYYIRAEGLLKSSTEIASVPITTRNGFAIKIGDVAEVRDGAAPRYGAMTRNGEGEVVGGITLMLKGANSDQVIQAVRERINGLQEVLPEGLSVHAYLDRSELVERTTSTVSNNLLEGGLIVIFVLVLMLGNLRAGLVVASVIPLSILFAFGMMELFGVSANLMSLGAIDFGLIVDGAVILVEATVHRLESSFRGQKLNKSQMDEEVIIATSKIRKSAAFGEVIILMVYIPLLALEGVEGKMFVPMAETVGFAILGALILSLTYVPMASALILSRKPKLKQSISDKALEKIHSWYEPILKWALRFRWTVLSVAVAAFGASLWLFTTMGGEFIPQLDEGDLAMQVGLPPGSSLSKSIEVTTEAEGILLANFPDEILEVVSKIGTAEIPTDPMGLEDADVMIITRPRKDWKKTENRYELVSKMEQVLEPLEAAGTSFEFTQPIELRFNELLTGSKSDISIKIFGDDLEELADIGETAVPMLESIQGAADVKLSRTAGFPQLSISYDRQRMASLGIFVQDVNTIIRSALAGQKTGMILDKDRRFDLVVRLHPDYRLKVEELGTLRIRAANGQLYPLSEVGDINYQEGPMLVSRENTRRYVSIGVNVRGRDVEQLVEEIQAKLSSELDLPPGYGLEYGGEFEQLQSARKRLAITVPLILFLIYALLFLTFGSAGQAILVFSAIPLATIGGVILLWLRDMPFSISAGVGFIALFGVSVLNGVVLIGYLNQLEKEGWENVYDRILEAAKVRFRPVLMTAMVASLGFLPMAISSGAGAEVQRPLATVVIGGLITATILTLIVLPVLYSLFAKRISMKPSQSTLTILLLAGTLFPQFMSAQTNELTEAEAIAIARQQAPVVQLQQAAKGIALAGERAQIDPGNTDVNWQQGQMNTERFDAYIGITQPLGQPWTVKSKKEEWQRGVNVEDSRMSLAANQAEQQVSRWYEEWFWHQARINLANEMLVLYDSLIRVQKLRAEAGEELPVERGILVAARGQWNLKKQQASRSQENIRFALKRWLSLQQLPDLPTTEMPDRQLLVSYDELSRSWEQTTAQKSMQDRLLLEEAKISRFQATRSPSLSAGYFGQTLNGVSWFQGGNIGLSVPLWRPAETSRMQQMQAARSEQQLRLELEAEAFQEQIHQAWQEYLFQSESTDFYQNQVDAVGLSLQEITLLRYRTGEISMLEAYRLLIEIASWRESLLDSQYHLHLSIITLNFLIR